MTKNDGNNMCHLMCVLDDVKCPLNCRSSGGSLEHDQTEAQGAVRWV